MVLTDDNFATIVGAVERRPHDLRQHRQVRPVPALDEPRGDPRRSSPPPRSAGRADGAPFTAIQILWVNLIMDGPPAMALGVDPPGPDTMNRAPRARSARILDRRRFLNLLGGRRGDGGRDACGVA